MWIKQNEEVKGLNCLTILQKLNTVIEKLNMLAITKDIQYFQYNSGQFSILKDLKMIEDIFRLTQASW